MTDQHRHLKMTHLHVLVAVILACPAWPVALLAQARVTICVVSELDSLPISNAYVQLVDAQPRSAQLTDENGCTTFKDVVTIIEEDRIVRTELVDLGLPYPNPTSGPVNIDIVSAHSGPLHYTVYDLLGREVKKGWFQARGRNQIRIELEGAPGVYFAHFSKESASSTVKIVKSPFATSGLVGQGSPAAVRTSPGLESASSHTRAGVAGASMTVYVAVLDTPNAFFGRSERFVADSDTLLIVALEPVPDSLCSGEIFVIVENMPELIGGLASIQKLLTYPEETKSAGIEGRVIVQFIVSPDGRIFDAVVVRGVSASLDEEALRAVHGARFKPGLQRGVPVCVKMSLPITFKLD